MGNRFFSPMSRTAQAAIGGQIVGTAMCAYALVTKEWQTGNGHSVGLFTACQKSVGCRSITSNGLTPEQWAGVLYPRIMMCIAVALAAVSWLPTVVMCQERKVERTCCGAFFLTFLPFALITASVLLYLSLATADFMGHRFGLSVLYAMIAAGFLLCSSILLIVSRRLYAKAKRGPLIVYM